MYRLRIGDAAVHIDALTLVNTLHLLTLCRLAVRLAHRPAGCSDIHRDHHRCFGGPTGRSPRSHPLF